MLIKFSTLKQFYYLRAMTVETSQLITVHNFAKQRDVSVQYIYQLIAHKDKEKRLPEVIIDGMKFLYKKDLKK